jgi:hypothetical protein
MGSAWRSLDPIYGDPTGRPVYEYATATVVIEGLVIVVSILLVFAIDGLADLLERQSQLPATIRSVGNEP